jgi:CRISPR-associated protein Csx3
MEEIRVFLVDNEGFVFQYMLEDKYGNGIFYAEDRNDWYNAEEYEGSPLNPEHITVRQDGGKWSLRLYEGSHWEYGDRDEAADIPGYLEAPDDWAEKDDEGGEFVTFSAEEAEEVAQKRKGKAKLIVKWDIGTDTPVDPSDPLPPPDIPRGALLVIGGRAPVWRYGLAFHAAHGGAAGAIATYDPKLGAVVVASHSKSYKTGQVLKDFKW